MNESFTEAEIKAIQEKVRAFLKDNPGADAKVKYAESVAVILNSGTDRKKTIEAGDNGNSEN